jgi:cytochrome P450 family 110
MKLALATILTSCELKLVNTRPIKPTRRGLTVAPPANMQMVVTLKKQENPVLV